MVQASAAVSDLSWHAMDPAEALSAQSVDAAAGLSSTEVDSRRQKFGPNKFATGVLLIMLTLLNAFLGLNQEGKAEASVAALQKMMVVKAKVVRDGETQLVAMEELVPGDIVNVEAGDLVPGDGRIVRAATPGIDEKPLPRERGPRPQRPH